MHEDQRTQTESHRIEHYEDEIELIDILRVIWKWKYFILLGTAACGLAAAIISFSMPKIYRIDMTLQPGIVSTNQYVKKFTLILLKILKLLSRRNHLGKMYDAMMLFKPASIKNYKDSH